MSKVLLQLACTLATLACWFGCCLCTGPEQNFSAVAAILPVPLSLHHILFKHPCCCCCCWVCACTAAVPALLPPARPKKRARVAAAPERYADLVSNMTSQGGGDDTDSDADHQAGANTREVRCWWLYST